jgi:hypothetical protein
MTIDLSLKTTFYKTPLGYLVAGFNQADYAKVKTIADLTPAQRRDLAGAYWISPENSSRFPLSVDLVKFASKLFTKGVSKDGELPWEYKGKTLSLKDVVQQTSLQFFGFYGGRDVMVPDRSAFCLMPIMGKRYTHVVHPTAGHISYVLSPKLWAPKDKRALEPNPISLLLDRCLDKPASIDA